MKRNGQSLITRLAVLLLAVLLVPVLAYSAFAAQQMVAVDPECYEHGDVNGDGIVDSRDAVQILYHSIFDDDTVEYPVNQDCDFNGDGKVDNQDAIYVLYGSFQVSQYPLEGQIHQFYAPEWSWTTGEEVKVTFKCGCGQSHSFTQGEDIIITSEKTVAETCLSAGKMVYTSTIIFGGEEFTDTYEVVIPATGHNMTGTQDCTTASVCSNCGYTVAALGHNWVVDSASSKAATCQTNAVEAFKCSVCGATKSNTLEGLARHDYVYVEDTAVSSCVKAKLYRCSSCGEEVKGDTYATHTYAASIEAEASCVAAGVKKYTCVDCGDSYTEEIPANDAHTWDAGVTENNITTYTCGNCGTTKTAVVAEGNTATVAKEDLQNSEVQVNNAAIKLDQETLEDLGEEVKIDVEVVDTADVNINAELKAQIGENPVYDFSLSSDETQVSKFAGSVTISLPYTLQEDDDVDCIDVWFINDDGEVECVMGTYSNGFVTFTTDHFSYYTVTRLTPKQRCENYGHLYTYSYKAPTCTANGHDIQTCKRCGHVEKDDVLPMVEHKYIETVQDATCTEDGYVEKSCAVCKKSVVGVLPSLGHEWVLDQNQSQEATCYEAGCEVFYCSACDETYSNDLAQLEHQYEISAEFEADCVNHGYKTECCYLCGDIRDVVTEAPLGHEYAAENAIWEWDVDYASATVTLVCTNDVMHTKTLTAVVGRDKDAGLVCSDKITYKAVASFNKVEYTDTKEADLGVVSHDVRPEWLYDEDSHYHECLACGQHVAAADHEWDDGMIIVAETCGTEGQMEYMCIVCGATKQEVIPANGDHIYEDHVCTSCGEVENTCDHYIKTSTFTVDNEKWGICEDTIIEFGVCECGQYYKFINRDGCMMDYVGTETITTPKGEYGIEVYACAQCGLVSKMGWYEDLDVDTCTSTWYDLYALYMNGELIAADYSIGNSGIPYVSQHNENAMRYVDMKIDGACYNSVMETYCYCGEFTSQYMGESDCKWEYVPSNDEMSETFRCAVCGLTYTSVFESRKEGCEWNNSRTYTFVLNGEEVYSFAEEWGGKSCDSKITKIEYLDGGCENGVMIYWECPDCGDGYWESWYGSHCGVYEEFIHLENDDVCYNDVTKSTCACGEVTTLDYYTNCDFTFYDNLDGTVSTGVCVDCGLTFVQTRSYSEKDEDCNCYETVTYTYLDADGNKLLEVQGKSYGEFHNNQTTYELVAGATSCEDGVVVKRACADCGLVVSTRTEYDHETYLTAIYDSAEYGMCGGEVLLWVCACGTEYSVVERNSKCDFQYTYTPETGMYYQCHGCNTIRTYDRYMVSENGCVKQWNWDTVYIRDGEEVLRVTAPYKQYNHRYYYVMELLGETCEDGYYQVEQYCADCNYYDCWNHSPSDHETWIVEREYVSNGKLCGDLELITYSCACGENVHTDLNWINGECVYDGSHYVSALNAWSETCVNCGIEHLVQVKEEQGATRCEVIETNIHTFRKKGVNLFSFQYRQTKQDHDYLFTFQLLGETCYDGYYVSGVCADCGEICKDCNGTYSGNGTWQVERVLLDSNGVMCGEPIARFNSCACGCTANYYDDDVCNWEWIDWDDETNTTILRCTVCGVYCYNQEVEEKVPDSCDKLITKSFRYEKDNQVILQHSKTYTVKEHVYVCDLELKGTTCEEGYEVTEVCYFCGCSSGTSTNYSDHSTYLVELVELSDYGLCGGYIGKEICACGINSSVRYMDDACTWGDGSTDPKTGCDVEYCSKCQTTKYYSSEQIMDKENCVIHYVSSCKYLRDGEEVFSISGGYKEVRHTMAYSFEMNGESCEDGFLVTGTCLFCGYTYSSSEYDHYVYETKYLFAEDISDQLCGGYLAFRQCACGENYEVDYWALDCPGWSGYSKTETDENGVEHSIQYYTCDECGLARMNDSYSIYDVPNCNRTVYETISFLYEDEVVFEATGAVVRESHTIKNATYELAPGAETCEDGVIERAYCDNCGAYVENEYYSHMGIPVETIDLQQYGAVCSTQFVKYQCPCGYESYGSIEGAEKCDMLEMEIDHWISDVIDHEGQDNSEGYTYLESHSYMLTCAVTDPQCAFKIRKAEYYLQEGCEAVQYETWQYYDEAADTWQELTTFATGEKHTFHAYDEGVSRYRETGENSYVNGLTYTCVNCQSTYYYEAVHENGQQISYEEVAVNTLNNGKNQSRRYIWVDEFFYQGNGYTTYEAYDYIRADGSEYWEHYETEYDFSEGCNSVVTYTCSDGNSHTYDSEAHKTTYTVETIRSNTCSQFGEYIEHWYCRVCGEATDDYTYTNDPTCHLWSYYDEFGCYKCDICGLENVNGASGSIVMEDMTGRYGSDDEYVVGYWNRGELQVHKYVSVVLKDATEGQDDELILDGITFNMLDAEIDTITAVTFSQADTMAAAIAAMEEAGYTGDYAIRFTFVPENAEDTLDYAITFDSLTA